MSLSSPGGLSGHLIIVVRINCNDFILSLIVRLIAFLLYVHCSVGTRCIDCFGIHNACFPQMHSNLIV